MNLDNLKAPFPPSQISWRVGSTTSDKSKGMALAYIDARDVMERLDAVCGARGWQDRYEVHGSKTICYISINVSGALYSNETAAWITKADGAGDSDVEAEKGSLSDAFKRAAVKWGVGRYLYDLDSPWVELDTKEVGGKTFVKGIKKSEFAKLEKLLGGTPQARSAVNTPLPESLEPDPDTQAAIAYVQTAIQIISVSKQSEKDLRQWWADESGARREYKLTQAQVSILLGKLKEKIEGMANAEAA